MSGDGFRKFLLVFGLLHFGIFLCFTVVARMHYPAAGEFERSLAMRMLDGHIPYRDFVLEYPPLAIFAFLAPAIVFRSSPAYSFAFAGEMLIFDLIILVLIALMAERYTVSLRDSLIAYTAFLVAVGPLVVCRYDLLPAMLTLASLWAFTGGRTAFAWGLVALGFMAKVYPIVLVPLFFIYHLITGDYRRLATGAGVFFVVILAFIVPWLIIDAGGFWHSMTFHLERGLHSESSYGTVLLLAQLLGLTSLEGSLTFGSWNLSSPLADAIGGVSLYVTLGLLLLLYGVFGWLLARMLGRRAGTASWGQKRAGRLLFQSASLALLVFVLTNKVFSVQYLIWLCPLLPLVTVSGYRLIWLLFVLAAAITQYIFPYNYIEFELGRPVPVVLFAARNLLLLTAAVSLSYGLIRWRGALARHS